MFDLSESWLFVNECTQWPRDWHQLSGPTFRARTIQTAKAIERPQPKYQSHTGPRLDVTEFQKVCN